MEYLYGAFGHVADSVESNPILSSTAAVYVGTAPVNLVRGWADAGVVNHPVKITGMVPAQALLGYSKAWDKYTLCEVVNAHYNSSSDPIGPIYVINVLDPATHKSTSKTTLNLTFQNGKASFISDTIILDSVTVKTTTGSEESTLVEGADYTLDYSYNTNMVMIASADPNVPLTSAVVEYFDVDPSAVTKDDIIGGVSASGVYSGLGAMPMVYNEYAAIPNLLAAPGWSQDEDVYNAMISAARKINGHWDAYVVADIPLSYNASAVDTIAKAVEWKSAHAYNSEHSTVCWPQAKAADGKIYHLSTLITVEYLRSDTKNGGIPMRSAGNIALPVVKQYFGETSPNQGYDKVSGNELTQNGITTLVPWAGKIRSWGDHTALYKFGAVEDGRCIFDVSVRMLKHVTNNFQDEWNREIDSPMTRNMKDRILNREQEKLDALVTQGALIGTPTIQFVEGNNSIEELKNGFFRFDSLITPTPPMKAVSLYIGYTDEGFGTYYDD